jgi:hypothetical protein
MYLKVLLMINILNFSNCPVKGLDPVTITCNGILLRTITGSHSSLVSRVTRLQAGRYRILTPPGAKMFFSSKKHPDRLWHPLRLLYDGCGPCLRNKAAGG